MAVGAGSAFDAGEFGVTVGAGAALPVDGAPGASELGVAVGAGAAVVCVDGALGAFELGVAVGVAVGTGVALVPVCGAPSADKLAPGGGANGVEGSEMAGHLPQVIWQYPDGAFGAGAAIAPHLPKSLCNASACHKIYLLCSVLKPTAVLPTAVLPTAV